MLPDAGLFGYGLGDGNHQLINCFERKESHLASMSYNTHNQYVSLLLNIGFIGLIVFLASIFIHTIISLNAKNHLAVAVVIFFAVWMLSENILERQGGVMYFALFTGMLFLINFKFTPKNSNDKSHQDILAAISN